MWPQRRRSSALSREDKARLKEVCDTRVALVVGTAFTLLLTISCGLLCISTVHSKLWWLAYVTGLSVASILLTHHTTAERRFFMLYATLAFLETSIWFWMVEHLVISLGDWILAGALLLIAMLSSLLYRRRRRPD
jgi:hypothetical protein